MNWEYISGFLDADGSVGFMRDHIRARPTTIVSFHNSELTILKKIRSFIEIEIGRMGSLSCKRAKKESHRDSYDLKYSYKSAIEILKRVNLVHPKKRHRKNILLKAHKLLPKNGKFKNERAEQKWRDILKEYK